MPKLLKLTSGEIVLAQIEQEDHIDGIVYKLKDPVMLVLGAGPDQRSVGMVPLCPFADGPISVNKNHVVFMTEPNDNAKSAYNQQFGSGIVTASGPLQLPPNS